MAKKDITIGTKTYEPDDEVGIRGMLVNQMGIANDDIGWREGKDSGTVTVKGNDFMNVGSDNLKNGSSFANATDFSEALANYSQMFGYNFGGAAPEAVKKSDPMAPQNIEFISPYSGELDEMFQKIENYSYDPDTDPKYQALETRYKDLGQDAMRDTLGAASSLTGGRLNSHAQMASQSVYDDYMGQLAGMVPGLEEQGLSKLYDMFNALQSRDNTAYDRFNTERNVDLGIDQFNETMDYNKDRDSKNDAWNQKNFDYGVNRDAAGDAWNQKKFDYQVDSDEEARFWDNFWNEKNYNLNASRSSGSGSSDSSSEPTAKEIANYEQARSHLLSGESRYGSDRLSMIKAIANDQEKLEGRMGEELFSQLLEEARGYETAGPDYESNYAQALQDLSSLGSDQEALDYLNANTTMYEEFVTLDGYNDLVEIFEGNNREAIEDDRYNSKWQMEQDKFAEDKANNERKVSQEQDEAYEEALRKIKFNYNSSGMKIADIIKEIEQRKDYYTDRLDDMRYQELLDYFNNKL